MATHRTLSQPETTSLPAATTGSRSMREGRRRFGRLMTIPTLVALAIVVAFPLGFALWVSVHFYDLTKGGIGPFIGLTNYAETIAGNLFAIAARNTAVYSVSVVVLELLIALGLSLLLNLPGLRFRGVYLAILLIPLLVSPVAVGLIWRLLLHPDVGAVNWLLTTLHLPPQEWMSRPNTAMATIVGVDVWHETSLMIVIILAGLTSLPRDPIEASMVDGANRWQTFRSVTLPLLMPVLLVATLIRFIAAMKTYDLVYILTRGGPGSATETISFSIWKAAFTTLEMGRAAAASFLLLIIILVLVILLVRLMGDEEAEA
ncbi:MAG: sugar ABC transporter permease [Thermomicrobiales bacterium]|nr:sugar ABC transporter permease [Thermomicrobiales bacterium]